MGEQTDELVSRQVLQVPNKRSCSIRDCTKILLGVESSHDRRFLDVTCEMNHIAPSPLRASPQLPITSRVQGTSLPFMDGVGVATAKERPTGRTGR